MTCNDLAARFPTNRFSSLLRLPKSLYAGGWGLTSSAPPASPSAPPPPHPGWLGPSVYRGGRRSRSARWLLSPTARPLGSHTP